jgi:hypothetical protein
VTAAQLARIAEGADDRVGDWLLVVKDAMGHRKVVPDPRGDWGVCLLASLTCGAGYQFSHLRKIPVKTMAEKVRDTAQGIKKLRDQTEKRMESAHETRQQARAFVKAKERDAREAGRELRDRLALEAAQRIRDPDDWCELVAFSVKRPGAKAWAELARREFGDELHQRFVSACSQDWSLINAIEDASPEVEGWDEVLPGEAANWLAGDVGELILAAQASDWDTVFGSGQDGIGMLGSSNSKGDGVDPRSTITTLDNFAAAAGVQTDHLVFTNVTNVPIDWSSVTLGVGNTSGLATHAFVNFGLQVGPAPQALPIAAISRSLQWVLVDVIWQPGTTWANGGYLPHFRYNTTLTIPPGHNVYVSVHPDLATNFAFSLSVRNAPHCGQSLIGLLGSGSSKGDGPDAPQSFIGTLIGIIIHIIFGLTGQEAIGMMGGAASKGDGVEAALRTAQLEERVERPVAGVAGSVGAKAPVYPSAGTFDQLLPSLVATLKAGTYDLAHGAFMGSSSVQQAMSTYIQQFVPTYMGQGGLEAALYTGYHESYLSEVAGFNVEGHFTSRRYGILHPDDKHSSPVMMTRSTSDAKAATQTGDILTPSQYMRINTTVFNGDSRMRGILADAALWASRSTGSMAALFCRLFLYCNSEVPLLGPEFCQAVGNTNATLGAVAARNLEALWWPLSPDVAAAAPAVNARLITASDYTAIRSGATDSVGVVVPAGFTPADYGVVCAVVPLSADLYAAHGPLVPYVLAHMEYPYQGVTYTTTVTDDLSVQQGLAIECHPMSNSVRVPGPRTNVLFVLADTLAGGASVTIGDLAPAVLTYAANNFGPLAVSVDIGPALAATYANVPSWQRSLGMGLRAAFAHVGSIEDVAAGFLAAADHSYITAPGPQRTRLTVQNAYYSHNAADPVWAADYTEVSAANLPVVAQASTFPIDPLVVVDAAGLLAIQNNNYHTCHLGVLDPTLETYMVMRMIVPEHQTGLFEINNLPQLALGMRMMAGHLTQLTDEFMRHSGLPMEELLSPGSYAVNQMSPLVQDTWDALFAIYTDQLFRVIGMPIRYRPNVSDMTKGFYAGLALQTIPWGRAPRWMLEKYLPRAEIYIPEVYNSPDFGDYQAAINFPAAGNIFEVWSGSYESPASAEAHRFAWLGAAAVINPTNPAVGLLDLQTTVIPQTGTVTLAHTIMWPATHPSIGSWVRNVFANYAPAILNTPAALSVDWPIYSTPPKTLARIQQDVFFMTFGNLVNIFRPGDHRRILNLRIPTGPTMSIHLPIAQRTVTKAGQYAAAMKAARSKNGAAPSSRT